MAVRIGRWISGAAAVALALAGAFLPARGYSAVFRYLPWAESPFHGRARDSVTDTLQNQFRALQKAAGSTATAYMLAAWRDTVLADPRIRGGMGRTTPALVLKAPLPAVQRQRFEMFLQRVWQVLPARSQERWTAVVVIPDSVFGPARRYMATFPPRNLAAVMVAPDGAESGCIVLVSATAARVNRLSKTALEALSPCAWLAAFGTPGSDVGRWLARRGWSVALGYDWSREPTTGEELMVRVVPQRMPWGDPGERTARGALESALAIEQNLDLGLCIGRRAESCGRWIERASGSREVAAAARRALFVHPDLPQLGLGTSGFLSELLRKRGPEQFARFWRSEQPLDEAFRAAAGEPLGEFTRRFMADRVGPIRNGPWADVAPVAWSLVMTLGFLVVMLLAVGGRRAG